MLHVEGKAAQRLGATQPPVVSRLQLLHELRFAQSRTELSDAPLPIDAAHLARPRPARVKMLEDPRAHVPAHADVKRNPGFAVEHVHARRLWNLLDRRTVDVRR